MTAIISEATKQELMNLAGSLNDVVNDIHRQVRTGKVFTHNYDTWMKLKKVLEE